MSLKEENNTSKMSQEIDQELKNIAPKLHSLPKIVESRQAIPSGYFTHFSDRIMHQIYETESLQKRPIAQTSLLANIKTFFAQLWTPQFAISMTLSVFLIGFYFINRVYFSSNEISLQAINRTEILDYLKENADDIDESAFSNLSEISNTKNINANQEQIKEYLEDQISSDDVEEI